MNTIKFTAVSIQEESDHTQFCRSEDIMDYCKPVDKLNRGRIYMLAQYILTQLRHDILMNNYPIKVFHHHAIAEPERTMIIVKGLSNLRRKSSTSQCYVNRITISKDTTSKTVANWLRVLYVHLASECVLTGDPPSPISPTYTDIKFRTFRPIGTGLDEEIGEQRTQMVAHKLYSWIERHKILNMWPLEVQVLMGRTLHTYHIKITRKTWFNISKFAEFEVSPHATWEQVENYQQSVLRHELPISSHKAEARNYFQMAIKELEVRMSCTEDSTFQDWNTKMYQWDRLHQGIYNNGVGTPSYYM